MDAHKAARKLKEDPTWTLSPEWAPTIFSDRDPDFREVERSHGGPEQSLAERPDGYDGPLPEPIVIPRPLITPKGLGCGCSERGACDAHARA